MSELVERRLDNVFSMQCATKLSVNARIGAKCRDVWHLPTADGAPAWRESDTSSLAISPEHCRWRLGVVGGVAWRRRVDHVADRRRADEEWRVALRRKNGHNAHASCGGDATWREISDGYFESTAARVSRRHQASPMSLEIITASSASPGAYLKQPGGQVLACHSSRIGDGASALSGVLRERVCSFLCSSSSYSIFACGVQTLSAYFIFMTDDKHFENR